jgi:hypothetical protein
VRKTSPPNVEPDVCKYYYTKDRANTSTPGSTDTTHETSALTEPPIDPKLEQYLAGQDHAGR